MKETKFEVVGSSSGNGLPGNAKPRVRTQQQFYNVGFMSLVAVSALMVLQRRDNATGSLFEDFKRMVYPLVYVDRVRIPHAQEWDYSSHSFQPDVSDWDDQRAAWMEEHPNLSPLEGGQPKVLMVTGSSPEPCELSILLQHLLLRAGKNKLDYCRMHDMQLYYNMGNPDPELYYNMSNLDPEFSDRWVKLPVIRMLMLQHPEVEWIWWLDADAILTKMSFEPPFAELQHHNLVINGDDRLVYDSWDRTGLSTGAFMIRNCQWSLDLLGAWMYMGTASILDDSRKFQSETGDDRLFDFRDDDQSSLVVLLARDKKNPVDEQQWIPMVKMGKDADHFVSGNWTAVGPKLEELSLDRVPFVTHFTGCLPSCTSNSSHRSDACVEQLDRALDFADNQVYQQFGRQPLTLGTSSKLYPLNDSQSDPSEDGKDFRILPTVTNWDETRQAHMANNSFTHRDEAVLAGGSPPAPCFRTDGGHLLLRGFKNWIDYGRLHGIKCFYNMAIVDKGLTGWWSKLPLLRMLMLNNPAAEWIWWMDSDAVFTDMNFRIPFERYNASYNLVMYGTKHEVFDLKKYNGINTGNFLIRNCQWSLDLLDRWGSYGVTDEIQVKNGELMSDFLSGRPHRWAADDQSSLVYLLVTEREKWASKVYFEEVIIMSGEWTHWTALFVDKFKLRAEERPFVTHFAGCHPCHESIGDERCILRMDRTFNFADNQVLENYGLRHEYLNSSLVTSHFLGDVQEWTAVDIEHFVNGPTEELSETTRDFKADKPDEEDSIKSREDSDEGKEEPPIMQKAQLNITAKELELNSTAKKRETPKEQNLNSTINESEDSNDQELDTTTKEYSGKGNEEDRLEISREEKEESKEDMEVTKDKLETSQEKEEEPKEDVSQSTPTQESLEFTTANLEEVHTSTQQSSVEAP